MSPQLRVGILRLQIDRRLCNTSLIAPRMQKNGFSGKFYIDIVIRNFPQLFFRSKINIFLKNKNENMFIEIFYWWKMVRIFEILTKSPFFRQRKKFFFSRNSRHFFFARKIESSQKYLKHIQIWGPNSKYSLKYIDFTKLKKKGFFSSICDTAGHGAFKGGFYF